MQTRDTPLLEGLTVIDFASVGPAARASRILADYGAKIIKIGPIAAKSGKQIIPPFHTYGAGRGMQKIRVDLKSPAGRDVVCKLAGYADVIIESYRPGVADRLGIGYADMKAYNRRIVYCSTSGYGQDGPYSSWAGHDINYLAVGGFLDCSGRDENGVPAIPGATVADGAGGGMHAALAIMAALFRRNNSSEGTYLDVSITDGVVNLMSLYLDQYLAGGEETRPRSGVLTGKYACYGIYATADEKFVSVGAIEPHFFQNLCTKLDLAEYCEHQYVEHKQDMIRAAFQRCFLTKTRDQWTEILSNEDTCVAPVLAISEVVRDRHLRARDTFMGACHPEYGSFEQVGPVLAGSLRKQPVHRVQAYDVSDCDTILSASGFTTEEISRLHETEVVE